MQRVPPTLFCLEDYESAARAVLNAMAYEYLASGVADDVTLRWNRAAYQQLKILPRIMVDVSAIDTTVEIFGRRHSLPILLAPTGYHRLFHEEGEIASAQGADRCQATLVAASFATIDYRTVRQHSKGPMWFQLYVQPDRGYTRALLDEVVDSGCEAVCVTADFPVNSPRDRERRVSFALPAGMSRANLSRLGDGGYHAGADAVRHELYNAVRAPDVTWKDIEWLRSFLRVPLLLKGVARADDARTAVAAGCDGLMVSNHGGRSVDGIPASIDLLPRIAEAVGGSATILVDGGIRRGTDVLKALALGAQAVMIGRPYLYGLALNGAQGVADVVNILATELRMAMGNTGCASLADIDGSLLERASQA